MTDPLRDAADTMRAVRDRCVWTQQIDHRALVPYLVEESAELMDAVEDGTREDLREELGDLLWQVLFHAEIASRDADDPFDIDDVARGLTDKMVRRHPHVFGDAVATTPEEVLVHWNAAKAAEKQARTSVLDGVSHRMPSLALAQKLLGKAAGVGRRPPVPTPVPELVEGSTPAPATEAELGDALLGTRRDGPHQRLGRRARAARAPPRCSSATSERPKARHRRPERIAVVASVNPPRGMRDFLPADKARRERVLAVIRERYRAHGFDEIETPVVEEYERLHAGIGGDNEKLAFNILKRGLDADAVRAAADDQAALTDLGLRYDLTVPLARFYASHRAELPSVFRSIQIAPVWRAERPQKGRYRQFVQCDIDIIGDASARAEAELVVATLDTLDALGLEGGSIRINDRRALDWMLDSFGFTPEERPGVLITIDKLDKIGPDGVAAELRERALRRAQEPDFAAVDAFEAFLVRPVTLEYNPFGERQIRKALPEGAPDDIVAHLVGIGEAVAAARGSATELAGDIPLVFDPFLVRGMGYYTGTIFELAHPSVVVLARRRRALRRHDRPFPRPGCARGGLLDRIRADRRPRRGGRARRRGIRRPRPRPRCAGQRAARAQGGAPRGGLAGAPRAAHEEPEGAAGARGIRRLHGVRDRLGGRDARGSRAQAARVIRSRTTR